MTRAHWLFEEKQFVQFVEPLAVFGIALAGFLVVRYLVLRYIARQAPGPKSFSTIFVETIRYPSALWSLAAALAVALEFTELSRKQAYWTGKWIGAFVIVSLTLVFASIAVRMIGEYGERQGVAAARSGLARAVVRVLVLALGAMILLANFDISITPLLTTLGVGGIAVALALQDTLANFFAGIHLVAERPIFVGDFIRLESGQEGVVSDIGWRTTQVRTGGNDIVVIPNTKITSGILVNYSAPEPRAVAAIPILVAHQADAEQVCRIALEEARRAEGVLTEPAPLCLCDPGVLATHLEFKLFVHVANRLQQGAVQSEIRMRLLQRFHEEGIPLPNPWLSRNPDCGT